MQRQSHHSGLRAAFAFVAIAFIHTVGQAAEPRIGAGDILDPPILTALETGAPIRLADFEGKILYLEWFYWW